MLRSTDVQSALSRPLSSKIPCRIAAASVGSIKIYYTVVNSGLGPGFGHRNRLAVRLLARQVEVKKAVRGVVIFSFPKLPNLVWKFQLEV